ncbi:MAG: hypothetical protein ACP5FK_10705 [bacterium]
MIGILIEAKTKCPSCSSMIALNAMVDKITCTACGNICKFTMDNWETIIGNALEEVPYMEELEGSSSTIFSGNYNYEIVYGRQHPSFRDDKQKIDIDQAIKQIVQGWIANPLTGKKFSVRAVPQKYQLKFPGIKYLFCEQFELLPTSPLTEDQIETKSKTEPVYFNCPKCGGGLEIDGSQRLVNCRFCHASAYIPDDLWLILHPVKTVSRWYIWFDQYDRVFRWEEDLWDGVVDSQNNLYLVCESSNGNFKLVCLNQEYKPTWIKNKLDFKTHTTRGDIKLSLTTDENLILHSYDQDHLLLIDRNDGSVICSIPDMEQHPELKFKYWESVACDIDDSLLVYLNPEKKDAEGYSYYELLRFDLDLNPLPTWPHQKSEKPKWYSWITNLFKRTYGIPYFSGVKNRFEKLKDFEIKINIGSDGNYYFSYYNYLLKYNRYGEKIYYMEIPCNYLRGKVVGDSNGYAYALTDQSDDRNTLIRISPDGQQAETYVDSIKGGGLIGKEEFVLLSPSGYIFLLGYGGRIRVLSPDKKLIFISERSKKDEQS